MNRLFIALCFGALVALGFIAFIESRRLASHQEQLASARAEQEQTLRAAEELEASNLRLTQEREALRDQLQSAAATAPSPASNGVPPTRAVADVQPDEIAKPDKDPTGMGKMLSKMMDDPETRKFIRDQQRQMLDPLYAPLLKQLNLTPEQATQFKDFLADTQMKSTAAATSLLGGSSSNRTEAIASLAADQKTADEQIKAFLGDAGYAQYKDYQLTLGERTQLQQFKTQTGGENALTDQQTETLLVVMKEEKQNTVAMTGQAPPDTAPKPNDIQGMLGQAEQTLLLQEQVNQRVYERARSLLPEPQLDYLGRFQTNQLQTLRAGLSMAKKMFAPEGGTARPGQ